MCPRQPVRIQRREDVPGNEIALIRGFAVCFSKTIFKGSERTDPAGEFHEDAPDDRRHVEPREVRPPVDKEPSEDDEQDE